MPAFTQYLKLCTVVVTAALCVAMGVSSVGLRSSPTALNGGPTEFYLAAPAGYGSSVRTAVKAGQSLSVPLVISNCGRIARAYKVVVYSKGEPGYVSSTRPLKTGGDCAVTATIALNEPGVREVVCRLYLRGDRNPYRELRWWVYVQA